MWPQLSKQDPDILLSIGTGFDPLPPGVATDPGAQPTHGIRSYIRKMIKLGSAAISEDMDCEIMWQEFIGGLGIDDNTPERLKRYQRLNPRLDTPVPKLDDVDQMEILKTKAREFIIGGSRVKEIANTMIGSLFYFELQIVSTNHSNPPWPSTQWGCDLNCTGNCAKLNLLLGPNFHRYNKMPA